MEPDRDRPHILALCRSGRHSFSKEREASLRLLAGLGVEGDIHCGEQVKHHSRVAVDPTQPNLRQVHLMQSELVDELRETGFQLEPGQLGENVTSTGLDLLGLPPGTILCLGTQARIEVTGLRNPCAQIESFQRGLLSPLISRDVDGQLIRRAGIMAIVRIGGEIQEGDPIRITLPAEPHRPLECV